MEYYLRAFQKYSDFSGRATRTEFWMAILVNAIIHILAYIVLSRTLSTILSILYGLIALIPFVALSIRRLHDAGHSGWWFILAFVPLGPLVLLYFYIQDSVPTENMYGPNPKAPVAVDVTPVSQNVV